MVTPYYLVNMIMTHNPNEIFILLLNAPSYILI